ncbi:MAG TPA: tetratricopeptide repeat protein [Gemmatimonadales bacterium]|nr:tetratricopeptide repeat protein [Gemmatimonadales bacterium]
MTSQPFAKAAPHAPPKRAGELLRTAREHDRAGRLDHALADYDAAIQLSEKSGERTILIESLRRLGVLHHRRNSRDVAAELCRRSHSTADGAGDRREAGEALNVLGRFDLEAGEMQAAARHFERALALAGKQDDLRGRIEQNLGVMATMLGDREAAQAHFTRALQALEASESHLDCGLTWHDLGRLALAAGDIEPAVSHLARSADIAKSLGDIHLEGLCHLSQAELLHGQAQLAAAKTSVLRALEIFELLDIPLDRSAAHRVLGMVYRDTGKHREAAHQFRRAVQLAEETRWMLGEANALVEMARLNLLMESRDEATAHLTTAHGLYSHMNARLETADVSRQLMDLATG